MKIAVRWNSSQRKLSLHLLPGSRMLVPLRREIDVRIVPEKETRALEFEGHPVEVSL